MEEKKLCHHDKNPFIIAAKSEERKQKQKIINKFILKLMIYHHYPIKLTEHENFLALLKHLCPDYNPRERVHENF